MAKVTRVVAVTLVIAVLLAGGAWLGYGERWLAPTGEAEGGAPPPVPRADAEGYVALPFRSEEPERRFGGPTQVLEPGRDYRARIETTAGTLTVDLFEDRAPRTVNNFVFLTLHRFYEGVPFHRVLDGFMAQTGDPSGTGAGGPGYTFEDEVADGSSHDRAGLLSMANRGPDTNGSQFFITFTATPWLDGRHAIFGEVVGGLETLDALTRIDPQNPSIVADLADPARVLTEQGVEAAEGAGGTVEQWLASQLGAVPDEGRSFRLGARRGVVGRATGSLAVGLFPVPDRIESITILAKDAGE